MRLAQLLPAALAFGAGIALSPMAQHAWPSAHAEAAPLSAAIIDLATLQEADLPATPNPDLRSKPLVVTESATIALQAGNVAKHFHAKSDEIQYIVEGTGTMWLGDQKREIRPGMLIVIPKNTAHAGTVASSGRFKAIAIKIPPQASGDTTFVN